MSNSGEIESKAEIDRLLDEYERKVGLPELPQADPNRVLKYLDLNKDELHALSSNDCAEIAVLLSSFAFNLTRAMNKERRILGWAKKALMKVAAPIMGQFQYISFDERLALAVKQDDYAQKLQRLIVGAQSRLDTLEDLPHQLQQSAYQYNNLRMSKEKQGA